ncbi:MAG: nodulation protein NolW, partial [Nitrosomonadales bacterium]|nr:nodulation protein NolW [Nitrosomonadales bacterium]
VEVATSPGARRGFNIDLEDNSTVYSNEGNEFLTVVDGERAFIRVGQSIPYTQQWVQLTRRYVTVQQTVEFQDITTGFAVRPRYIGDQIELEITPRIARLNQLGFIDFEELSTVVRVSPGEWFDLGGNMQNRDDVSRAILSVRRDSAQQNSSLKIRVD